MTTTSEPTRDFSSVTETSGVHITAEAVSMIYSRYRFVEPLCRGKDVLEVACGIGQGLGYLARAARSVVGGDCTRELVRAARAHYGDRVPVLVLDAQSLPLAEATFDVVILHEAIYYLPDPAEFLAECRRVLRPGGVVAMASINREWPEFNPSPFSVRYYSASELEELLRAAGFSAEIWAGFPVRGALPGGPSPRQRTVSLLKRTAVRWGLIPRSMRGKEILKRIFLGRLQPTPREIEEGIAPYDEPRPLGAGEAAGGYKCLYAVGRLA